MTNLLKLHQDGVKNVTYGEFAWLFVIFIPMFFLPKLTIILTRGPRGPWVAHLRKRSKVTVDQIIENPRGIIGTTLVEDL